MLGMHTQKNPVVRTEQAMAFTDSASVAPFKRASSGAPEVCIGIPSVERKGPRYLRLAIGSIHEGLAQEERDRIHLLVLIAHTDPETHPAYHDSWLGNLVDAVLEYDVPPEELAHLADLENEPGLFREKALFDHTYVLKACYATCAELIVTFEDDIFAMDGWFHRMITGTRSAARKSTQLKRYGDYLYMRLFYTEEYLGWNSEERFDYLSASLSIWGVVLTFVLVLSVRFPRRGLTILIVLVMCVVVTPALILLFFAAGRLTVFPRPTGVSLMNNFGCCTQGQVFPSFKVPDLVEYLTRARIGFIDTLTEAYADEHDELRWAFTPSVVQHIGQRSSKDDDPKDRKYKSFGYPVSHKLWSFPFEKHDAVTLRAEHQAALDSDGRSR